MGNVYVVIGEHPTVPGTVTSVHATRTGAEARTCELLNIMLKDAGIDIVATPATWESLLARLAEDYDNADVALLERELEA